MDRVVVEELYRYMETSVNIIGTPVHMEKYRYTGNKTFR